jgi:hypothetical protein
MDGASTERRRTRRLDYAVSRHFGVGVLGIGDYVFTAYGSARHRVTTRGVPLRLVTLKERASGHPRPLLGRGEGGAVVRKLLYRRGIGLGLRTPEPVVGTEERGKVKAQRRRGPFK